MGKVLVEKILRDCPDIKKMYLLIRAKKGMDQKERMYKIFQGPVSEENDNESYFHLHILITNLILFPAF